MQMSVSVAAILKFIANAARDNFMVQMFIGGPAKSMEGTAARATSRSPPRPFIMASAVGSRSKRDC